MIYVVLVLAAVAIAGFFLLRALRGGAKAGRSRVADMVKAGAKIIDVRTPE